MILRVIPRRVGRALVCAALASVAGLLMIPVGHGQSLPSNVFLKGTFLEIGVHRAGSLGTSSNAPLEFVARNLPLAMMADYGRDGWTVGNPRYAGDFVMPGTPVESWGVKFNSGGTTTLRNNGGLLNRLQMPPTTFTDTSTGTTRSVRWEGVASTAAGAVLKIVKTYQFEADALHMVVKTVLTNVSASDVSSVKYIRNVDPDPEHAWTGDFSSKNWVSQDGDRKVVAGRGRTYSNLVLGLGTVDPRAAVAHFGYDNTDPDAVFNSTIHRSYSEATPRAADEGIAVAFNLGTLAPAESVAFEYVYMFARGEFDTALDQLTPGIPPSGKVRILSPRGTLDGDMVPFRVTTEDVPGTSHVDFYVDGVFVGSDASADAEGAFEVIVDASALGEHDPIFSAVATFTNGDVAEAEVVVDNGAPFGRFLSPTPGAALPASSIVAVEATDGPPLARVEFFRETPTTGSTFLGEAAAPEFSTSLDVSDLPPGEVVVLKAVLYGESGRRRAIHRAAYVQGLPVSDNFLFGDYLEVGLHRAGSFGTVSNAPSTSIAGGKRLGMIADYNRDGWTTGTPRYGGDYATPGTPVESWGVQWKIAGAPWSRNNAGLMGRTGIQPLRVTNTSTASTRSLVWEGLSTTGGGQFTITKRYEFAADALHVKVRTTIRNVGALPLESLAFMRNIDPDPEQEWTGNFATENWVSENGDRKVVAGRGHTYRDLVVALAAVDPRAAVAHFGYDNVDADDVFTDTVHKNYSESRPRYSDEGIALAFRLGDLQPGQSVDFDYAYIFSRGEFDAVLDALERAATIVQLGDAPVSGTSVRFAATTNAVGSTERMDFYASDMLVGTDTTADDAGHFEVTLDSTAYPNGPLALRAVATFVGGATAEATATAIVFNKYDQTIDFAFLADRSYGDGDFAVAATASSGLDVTFSVAGTCTLLPGNIVRLTGAETCTVMATQPGDDLYNPAPDVLHTFDILPAATITVLASTPNPSAWPDTVTLTATVSALPTPTPSGMIVFWLGAPGGTTLGSVPLGATGTASFTLASSPSVGAHVFSATYSGDLLFAASRGSHTHTVLDLTPPQIVYSGNAGTYTVDQMVHITCSATDVGSGVASTTCADISGPAYSFAAGVNTFSASAVDLAGNVGQGTTSFTVVTSPESLQTLTASFSSNAGVTDGLVAKLQAAANAGNANARAGQLGAFEHQVRAQRGKALTAEQADTLLRWVQSMQ